MQCPNKTKNTSCKIIIMFYIVLVIISNVRALTLNSVNVNNNPCPQPALSSINAGDCHDMITHDPGFYLPIESNPWTRESTVIVWNSLTTIRWEESDYAGKMSSQ